VDLWWGDERFLPSGDPERNETQARAALLDALPLDPARVHPMAASDGPDGDDAEAAAARYAAELGRIEVGRIEVGRIEVGRIEVGRTEVGGTEPGGARFDVLMLGVGEDGHVASIFPGHPVGEASGVTAAVHDSPKPPPTRITLTMPVIRSADEVWLIASGEGKADAIGAALSGADLPAARATGRRRTLWLLDEAAAAKR
jgi:6-phosphogluconolactonase